MGTGCRVILPPLAGIPGAPSHLFNAARGTNTGIKDEGVVMVFGLASDRETT
jgi:hypothetical protein